MSILKSPFLLAADVDGTMLGDELGEQDMREFARQHAGEFILAYITGREIPSVMGLVDAGRLPRPDFICGNVGTTLLDCNDRANILGRRYSEQVDPAWDLETIYRICEGPGIWRQEFYLGQPPYQAGLYWDAHPANLQAFYERASSLQQVYIQVSYNKYIDILPASLGKGQVVCFLQEQLGLHPDQVMVAGDAGNDRQMFETDYQGVVPFNGLDELKAIATRPMHYHSPYPAARGVLDGLRHFGFTDE